MKKIIFIAMLLLAFAACKKAGDCMSNVGKPVIREFALSDFDTLVIHNNFKIYLVQDTLNKIVINAREKFADAFVYEIKNNSLHIDHNFRCPFMKPRKKEVILHIHVKEISLIKALNASKLFSQNCLTNDSEIGLIAGTKFFEADLNINSPYFYFWNIHLNGGKLNLRGTAETLKFWNVSLFGIDALGLKTDNAYIENSSKADIFVHPEKYLECKITGTGNVYYKGNPQEIIVNDSLSKGKLIKMP